MRENLPFGRRNPQETRYRSNPLGFKIPGIRNVRFSPPDGENNQPKREFTGKPTSDAILAGLYQNILSQKYT
jgi:hypothetical protein